MECPPGPAGTAMPFFIPFALSEQLQARAVDDQMPGSMRGYIRAPPRKISAPPAQCRVIGNAESEPQQAKHTAGECLSLAQGKVEHQAQHQHHLDRQIGVDRLSAWRVPPWRLPPIKGGLIDPECQIATPLQSCLIAWP